LGINEWRCTPHNTLGEWNNAFIRKSTTNYTLDSVKGSPENAIAACVFLGLQVSNTGQGSLPATLKTSYTSQSCANVIACGFSIKHPDGRFWNVANGKIGLSSSYPIQGICSVFRMGYPAQCSKQFARQSLRKLIS
jgi:hypothetical protein